MRNFGQGGIDQALFYNLGSDDHFYGRKRFGRLTAAAVATELYDFDDVILRHAPGRGPTADMQAIEYIFRRSEST